MIDYNKVKDLSEEETIDLLQNIGKEHEKIATTYNSIFEEEKGKNLEMVTQCDLLEFKFYSLRDVLWFKQSYISMELPEDIEEYISEKNTKNYRKNNTD